MKLRHVFGGLGLAALVTVAAASCSNSNSTTNESTKDTGAAAEGFTEVEIFSDDVHEFLSCSGVYFQAVSMTGLSGAVADYACHLELDIAATADGVNYGYGEGDWVPYLTVKYAVTQNGNAVSNGTFMPMMASDGPHYGNNVKLNGDGVYDVKFTIIFPSASDFAVHTDETGPKVTTWPETIEFTYEGWEFTSGAWNN